MENYVLVFLMICGLAWATVLSNVRLVNHADYMIDVISETMRTVEQMEWCNLVLPDIVVDLNETVLEREVIGTVRYTKGFTTAIQHVDIQQTTVQQVWSFNWTDETATVSVRGTLRMHNVAIGYDVIADLNDESHRYTVKYVHPLLSYAFSVNRNMHTNLIQVTVVSTVPRSTNPVSFLPRDDNSDVLTTLFDPMTTADGINAWGTEVFQPIAYRLVTEKIPFAEICYNCPA